MKGGFFRNVLLPRTVYLPFWIAWLLLSLLSFGKGLFSRSVTDGRKSVLCIEAGARGWESIEFKELHNSAKEYLGEDRVKKLVITSKEDYVLEMKQMLDQEEVTHYLYDPRTGSQKLLPGLRQAFSVALLLHRRNIVPIVMLTDPSMRFARAQVAVVSAKKGLVFCFMSARLVHPMFPHRRLIGPSLMPFSKETLNLLNSLSATDRAHTDNAKAVFTGSLYEPRITVLKQIQEKLSQLGHVLEIKGRESGAPRISDREYWSRLCHADLIITTADQGYLKGMDWRWIPQLVYRYLEVLAAGTLLLAPDVPGIHRYFRPGEHFVSFSSADEAARLAAHYLEHPNERHAIAAKGRERATHLIEARSFWAGIDVALGADALT